MQSFALHIKCVAEVVHPLFDRVVIRHAVDIKCSDILKGLCYFASILVARHLDPCHAFYTKYADSISFILTFQ